MPIYEYRCTECGSRFEQIVWRSDQPVPCPQCGHRDPEKLFSSFAVGGDGVRQVERESGPCACGAPQRGMCGSLNPN